LPWQRNASKNGCRDCSDGGKGGKADDDETGSSKGISRSSSDDGDNELKLVREAAREQAAQWAAAHLQGRRGGSLDSPDRRGCAGGWVDGDRGLYSRHDSPSPDRYHDHHEI
jgi:hypothetical protein